MVTDTSGLTTVYYYQAATLTATGTVAVTANTNSVPYTFTIAVPDADAAYPTNTPPPPPGSLPPLPPDLPVDGSVELRGEVVSVTKEKAGYDTFVETTPPKRYLIRTQWDERSQADSGSDVTLLDQEGGVAGYSYLGNVPDMYVDVTSGILHTKPEETSIYNWGIYGDSTDSDSQQLFKENTTKMLEQLAAKDMPAFSNTLTTATTSVTYNLDSTETHLTSGKLRYGFMSLSSEIVTLNWLTVFQPDSSNPNQTMQYILNTWTGPANGFGTREIDAANPKETGASGAGPLSKGDTSVVPLMEVLDASSTPISYVRFGLWDHAFSAIAPPSPITSSLATPTLMNDNAEATNFVGSDSRRFYLRITDHSANQNPSVAETVTVDWYTQKGDKSDEDHPATDTVTLTETGPNTDVFVSKGLMLVSDDVDNAQVTNTGLSGGVDAAMGAADHRLRRAALGDRMYYAYTPAFSGATKATTSVPIFNPSIVAGAQDTIKNITIHFVQTKTASHNTINSNDIGTMETQISARYTIAGIRPTYVHDPINDVLDVTSSGVNLSGVHADSATSGGDEYLIAQALRTKYGAFNVSDPTIYIIVIGKFSDPTTGGDSITDGVVAALPSEAMVQRCSFIAQLGGVNIPPATPHEVGHQLSDEFTSDVGTDNNHYDGLNLGQNLMYYRGDFGTQVTGAKRLWNDPAHADTVHNYQIDYMRQSPLCH